MSQLDSSHIQGLDDLDYDSARYAQKEDAEENDDPDVEEVEYPVYSQASNKKSRTQNYSQDEEIAL
jgi:hypothetical protein